MSTGIAAPVLTLDRVTVRFGAVCAVEDVTLSLSAGEVVGLIGPNGAGKTTLVNAIFGATPLAGGAVCLDGQDLDHVAPFARARRGMARTFQNLELFPTMTAYENVMVHLDQVAEGRSWHQLRQKRERAFEVLESVGIAHVARRVVRELAYPERKLVEFAQAMAPGPRLVLLDEPAAGIALEERSDLIDRMKSHLDARQVSGIVVEHDMQVIRRLCRKVHVLDSGRIIAAGDYDSVIHDPAVREAYLG